MKCWRRALYVALVVVASASEVLKETLSEEQCTKVVKKVQESGKYTEESIQPICNQEVKSSKCDFFSEALSLASSHSDFDAKVFCKDIAEAHFCSQTMDHVLSSSSVSDLAFGECLRAHETKGQTYCLKFEKMLSYAVQNDDLDTMRACYMIEAYEDLGAASDAKPAAPEKPPKAEETKIINGSQSKLDSVGVGSKPTTTTTPSPGRIVGQSGIVVKPKPLDPVGEGKANASLNATSEPETIITEPVSNLAVAVQRTQTTKHSKASHKVPSKISRTAAGPVTKSQEPVVKSSSGTLKPNTVKARNSAITRKVKVAKASDGKAKSSSSKPVVVSGPQERSDTGKFQKKKDTAKVASSVQPHGKVAPTANHETGANAGHRAGLASVHLAVKQQVNHIAKAGKMTGKDGKDTKDYGGFLSGFVA